MSRIVCQFSCGAASAVATKLAISSYGDVQIINAFLLEEHPDNRRFAAECEQWFDQPITNLRDEKDGASVVRVFRRKRFMMGPRGAPCSRALKRDLLDKWKQPGDIMVFGYTAEEADRLEDFRDRNPERPVIAPLIDAYYAFLTFYVWVFYKEQRWLPRVGWFVGIMLLGNMAMAGYVLLQLARLPAGAPTASVLSSRNP